MKSPEALLGFEAAPEAPPPTLFGYPVRLVEAAAEQELADAMAKFGLALDGLTRAGVEWRDQLRQLGRSLRRFPEARYLACYRRRGRARRRRLAGRR